MADNIIGNGSLKTLTISGSISLPYSDLYLLTDQGAVSSGISLTGETVYIEADISNRLNINDIRFYLTSATSSGVILGNLNFAYKNYEADNYTALDKNYNDQYFYVDNITQDFSPRYIRFDISSTTCELLEWEIYANDDIVAFGSDGLQTEYIVDDVPTDDYSTIQIYNNHVTTIANAYAAIEYTGADSDDYIELYDSQALTFYSLNDGVVLTDNNASSTYKWYQGTHNYTIEENNKIILSDVNDGFIFNPNDKDSHITITGNGLILGNNSTGWGSARTYGSINHGKFYFEVKIESGPGKRIMIGVGTAQALITNYPGQNLYSVGYYGYNGNKYYNAAPLGFGNEFTTGDIIGIAVDVDTGKNWWSKNGVWIASGDPDNNINPAYTTSQFINTHVYPMVGLYDSTALISLRIDSSSLDYTPPVGFSALSDLVVTTGTYITPVFAFDNQYASSYLITNTTTHSGIDNIGTDLNLDTVEIRSSDVEPVPLDEVYWLCTINKPTTYSPTVRFDRYNIYVDNTEEDWASLHTHSSNTYTTMYASAVNKRNGHVIHNWLYNRYGLWVYFDIIDRDTGESIFYGNLADESYAFDSGMEYNYYGSVWGCSAVYGVLALMDYSSGSMLATFTLDLGYDFVGDFSAELNGAGVWYTNKVANSLVHRDGSGNALLEDTTMTTPRAVCATSDNGCWVSDNDNYSLRRYNYNGDIIITGNLHREASKMINDGEDGFFYLSGDYVYHVLNTGQNGISVQSDSPTSMLNGSSTLVIYSASNDTLTIVDKSSGNILNTVDMRYNYNGLPAIYVMDQTTHTESEIQVLPLSYDPVWGVSGTLEWYTVKKNEYILPKRRYHQSKVTLTTTDYTSTPSLDSVAIPPAVKVQDIQPKSSKPLYIRTNFTEGATTQDYITNLRVWWEI